MTRLANPAHVAALVLAAALMPPPVVDLNAWAAENIRFGPESQFSGPYDPDRFPPNRRILEVLGPEHPVREVVLQGSAQIGKTVLAQIFVGGSLALDPGPMLYTHPTEPNAARWSKTKWRPFVRGTTALSSLFRPSTSRDATSSLLYAERRDGLGWLQISGANSEASLSMISVSRQVQDDLAKWELNSAGDPEVQADSRSKGFEWAKIFKISTPLVMPGCRITTAFRRGTQEHFHVPCPHCGHEHPLEWENMLAASDERRPELAHFTCPACGCAIEEQHRPALLRAGRWVAHNPGARVASFHLWAAYSPLESFERIYAGWLAARGDAAKEQVFANDTLGRPYETSGEAPAWEALRDRAEAGGRVPGIVPRGALLLSLGADVQDDRVEWQLVGWGRDLRRWVIQYGVVQGNITEPAAIEALDGLVRSSWRDFQGGQRPIDLVAIDGNYWTMEVLAWVKRHSESRVMMVRGVRGDTAPVLSRVRKETDRNGRVRKYGRRFFNVGVSPMKLALYQQLKVLDPLARGHCDFPAGLGDEYFVQLTSEKRLPVKRRDGFTEYRWVKPSGLRNEALDTALYAEAAAVRLGWRTMAESQWARLEADREIPPEQAQLELEDLLLGAQAAPAAVAVGVEEPDDEDPEAAAEAEPEDDGAPPATAVPRVVPPAPDMPVARPARPAAPEMPVMKPVGALLRAGRKAGRIGRFSAR